MKHAPAVPTRPKPPPRTMPGALRFREAAAELGMSGWKLWEFAHAGEIHRNRALRTPEAAQRRNHMGKEETAVIVRYIYRDRQGRLLPPMTGRGGAYADNIRHQLVGCVVRITKRYGYSLVHPKDRHKMSKRRARDIAVKRAKKRQVVKRSWIEEGVGITPVAWISIRNGSKRNVPQIVIPYIEALAAMGAEKEQA